MGYDPFARGPYPAGVRTLTLADAARGGRVLAVEVWYPATDAHRGRDRDGTRDAYTLVPGFPSQTQDAVRDAAPRPGGHPLVVFSHGHMGHRRQSTFLCTHLASHGYVVASADHTGNTVLDVVQAMMGGRPLDGGAMLRESSGQRPADVSFVIDRLLDESGLLVDPERIGMSGHSFGGWTTLATTARDRRIRAALALAPAGGAMALGTDVLGPALDFAWGRDVPMLFIVADDDHVLPLPSMHDLHARTRAPKRMVTLRDADHMHFCDNVEQTHEFFRTMPHDPAFAELAKAIRPIGQLCPGAHSQDVIRGLGLAHFDAVLCADDRAAALLAGDLRAVMAARGVRVDAA